jgi:hypothetical protein
LPSSRTSTSRSRHSVPAARQRPAAPITKLRFHEAELTDVVYLEQPTGAVYLSKPAERLYYWNELNRLATEAVRSRIACARLSRFFVSLMAWSRSSSGIVPMQKWRPHDNPFTPAKDLTAWAGVAKKP